MTRFVTLNERARANPYVARRAEKHGYIYKVTREDPEGIFECRSVATGVVVTLIEEHIEDFSDAVREQAPPVP